MSFSTLNTLLAKDLGPARANTSIRKLGGTADSRVLLLFMSEGSKGGKAKLDANSISREVLRKTWALFTERW